MEITRAQFDAQRHRRFGTTNPERMDCEFWQHMIRTKAHPHAIKEHFGLPLAERYTRIPIWSFSARLGMTSTQLPDGREICIGGEYDDFYDPDFCIYNEAIVFQPNGEVEIYGYPQEVFPPTDFHSATLVGNQIYIVGAIGYGNWRSHVLKQGVQFTPVFRLDCTTMQIEEVATTGEAPSWMCHQVATFNAAENAIEFTFGETWWLDGEQQRYKLNTDVYRLDLTTYQWSKIGVTKMKAALFDNDNERITVWHGNVLTPKDEETLSDPHTRIYYFDFYNWGDSDGNHLTPEFLGMDSCNFHDYFQRKLPVELIGLAQEKLADSALDEKSRKDLQQALLRLQEHQQIWGASCTDLADKSPITECAAATTDAEAGNQASA